MIPNGKLTLQSTWARNAQIQSKLIISVCFGVTLGGAWGYCLFYALKEDASMLWRMTLNSAQKTSGAVCSAC